MSTRCMIGIKKGDCIKAVYCHFDGYPSGVGEMLKEYYSNENRIDKLISLGYISALEKELEPQEWENHSFYNPIRDITVAYSRDRGEDLKIDQYFDENEYISEMYSNVDYIYLWKDSMWLVANLLNENKDKIKFERY